MTVHEARERLSHALGDAGIDHVADLTPAGRVRVRILVGAQRTRAGSDGLANAVLVRLRGHLIELDRTYVLSPARADELAAETWA